MRHPTSEAYHKAVQKFQAKESISPISGYVGTLTRAALNALIGATATPDSATTPVAVTSGTITENLTPGDSGAQVTILQTLLTNDGDYAGPVTGYYGSLTENGVEAFQVKEGIVNYGSPQTTGYGAVGPKTKVALDGLRE